MSNVIMFDNRQHRLIEVCTNIEREAIGYWKEHEKDFGRLVFKIKPKTDKLDVLAITQLQQIDVAIKGVVLYASWITNNK